MLVESGAILLKIAKMNDAELEGIASGDVVRQHSNAVGMGNFLFSHDAEYGEALASLKRMRQEAQRAQRGS